MLRLLKSLTRPQKRAILLTIDALLAPVALFFMIAVQNNTFDVNSISRELVTISPYLMASAALLSWSMGLSLIRLDAYERKAVTKTAVFTVYLTATFAVISKVGGLNLLLGDYVTFALSYFLFSITSRVVLLQVVNAIYRREAPHVRVLIYGAGTTGIQLASALNAHKAIDPVAFVDDNPALHGVLVNGLPVYSPVGLPSLVEKRRIDRILLAIPSASKARQSQIMRNLGRLKVEVQVLPSFSQLIGEEDIIDKLSPVEASSFLNRPRLAKTLDGGCEAYSGRNVMITGAGGTIGAELCRQVLNCRPKSLILFELSEFALYTIAMDLQPMIEGTDIEIIPVLGSVTDEGQVKRTLENHHVQVVFHAAAYKHVPLVETNPLSGLANNVFGTQTLAKIAESTGVERFVLISSDKAVRPTNVMGASKRMAEQVVQDIASRSSGTVFSIVRFGNVLGSSGSVVPLFQEQIALGGPVTLTHPDITRYFMTIDEAVRLVLRAGSFATGKEVYVLDMGEPRKIRDLAIQVIENYGYTLKDEDNPDGDIEIVITGLRPGEKMYEELLISEGRISTKHHKIFEAQEHAPSEIEVAANLRTLRAAITANDPDAARAVAAHCVEGYVPAKQIV